MWFVSTHHVSPRCMTDCRPMWTPEGGLTDGALSLKAYDGVINALPKQLFHKIMILIFISTLRLT